MGIWLLFAQLGQHIGIQQIAQNATSLVGL